MCARARVCVCSVCSVCVVCVVCVRERGHGTDTPEQSTPPPPHSPTALPKTLATHRHINLELVVVQLGRVEGSRVGVVHRRLLLLPLLRLPPLLPVLLGVIGESCHRRLRRPYTLRHTHGLPALARRDLPALSLGPGGRLQCFGHLGLGHLGRLRLRLVRLQALEDVARAAESERGEDGVVALDVL